MRALRMRVPLALLVAAGVCTTYSEGLHAEEPDSAQVLVIDEVIASPDNATSQYGGDQFGESFDDDEDDFMPPSRTWVKTTTSSRLMLDLSFSAKSGEQVVEWWNLGTIELDHKQGPLRLVAASRVRWGAVGQDPLPHHKFYGVNAANVRWTGEAELRESFADVRSGPFSLRIGQQIFVWGKNDLLPAADVLNPVDLRFGVSSLTQSLRDSKVPVFAADASWWSGDTRLQWVVLPFFTADRVSLVGRDFSLAPPGSGMEQRIRAVAAVHPSVDDDWQGAMTSTRRPEESPWQASLAARASGIVLGWNVAATAFNGWERTPRVSMDDDLRTLLLASEAFAANPALLTQDGDVRDALLAVSQKSALGLQLVEATHRRMWMFAVEGEGTAGDFVVKVDAGYSPGKTWYDALGEFHTLPSFQGTAGIEYTEGETLFLQLSAMGSWVREAPGRVREGARAHMIGLENALPGEDGEDSVGRRSVLSWGGLLVGRWYWEAMNTRVASSLFYGGAPQAVVAASEVVYEGFEPHQIALGALIFDGRSGSIGGRYDQNDYGYIEYRSQW